MNKTQKADFSVTSSNLQASMGHAISKISLNVLKATLMFLAKSLLILDPFQVKGVPHLLIYLVAFS